MCKAQQRLVKLKFVHELENLLQIEIAEMWIKKKFIFTALILLPAPVLGVCTLNWGAALPGPTPLTLSSE